MLYFSDVKVLFFLWISKVIVSNNDKKWIILSTFDMNIEYTLHSQ